MAYICLESKSNIQLEAYRSVLFHLPTFTGEESDCVQEAISSGNWTRVSEESKRFFHDYYGSKPFLFTNSCSSALEMAIRALDIVEGDEVIIPGFGYVALANAVVNNGAKPVFADVSFPDGNMDVNSALTCISARTRAIIGLHYAGNPGDIIGLRELCSSKNIYFIEDAAQCIGSTYSNKPLGSFGHVGCLSFDYMKNISCGQGGLIVINDPELLPKVQTIYDNGTNRHAMLNGTQKYFEWVGKGTNCQINPLASYFLSAQLKSLTLLTSKRLSKWNLYYQLLLPLMEQGRLILNNPQPSHNGHIFYVVTNSEAERDDLRLYLRNRGIFCEHHYSSLAGSPFGRPFSSGKMALTNSEKLCKQLLRLPLWHGLEEGQIGLVVAGVKAFYSNGGR